MNDLFRIKSDKYVTIANAFLKDKELSNKAKGVLAMILALPDDWDFSIAGMVAITKDGETSFRAAINELKEHNYCIMQPVKIAGKYARWKYYFSGDVITEEQLNDFLLVEKPLVENPKVENQGQYNNILNENNKENKKGDNNKSLSHKKGEEKPSRFVKPTVEQIAAYIKEKGLHFDAEHFFDYYESKGWMIGKNHMKDWKAACRTWEAKRKQDKEEKEESPAVDEAEMEQWGKTKNWLYFNAPRIAGHISYEDFKEMKRVAKNKPDVVADIIKAIDQSYYNGNILSEFCSLAREEGYRNRIEA